MEIRSVEGAGTAGQGGTGVSPRLVQAAHEFEGQMMKELLKPLTSGSELGSEDEEQGANGTLGEFASEALGEALSRHGGFGIADRIVKELSHSGNGRDPGKVTRNPLGDTVMRSSQ